MGSMYSFDARDGELVVRRRGGWGEFYCGRPEGAPVVEAIQVPDSDECLVLYDYTAYSGTKARNLVRLTVSLQVVWRAELPSSSGEDAFVGVELSDRGLEANTWSCYRVRIDLETGRLVESVFVK